MTAPDSADAIPRPPVPPAGGGAAAAAPESPGRLRWRCRRGMRELDVLLNRYLDTRYAAAAPDLQTAFRDLLDCQDPLIHAWCMGRERPPTAVLSVLIREITAGAGNER